MPIILPVTEIRNRLSALLDEVASNNEPVFITKHGRAQAVLISAAHYETLTKQEAGASTMHEPEKGLENLPFFGMWADRDDMRDSTAWVRKEREKWHQRVTHQD
ncbi:MAG: type II toxin-antitoxin system Phd/YefM family antitoxin [Candidatus Poribacteria bacterium]|nr:type II toxin-antitoxin system Phd/YefM family antitoxin [Candidatus Poribacteria bacterium]